MKTFAKLGRATTDILVLVRRNVLRYLRSPSMLAVVLLQPLIVLLLFRYILGGQVIFANYVEYLLPGIFALAVINGSATVGIGLADDLASGMVDHLRAQPIARSAFLAARAITDIQRNVLVVPLVGALGAAVGFHFIGSVSHIALAGILLIATGCAFAWVSMTIALWTGSGESTQGITYIIALVFCFASSGFAPVWTMPSWLRRIIEINPVTHVDDAMRSLTTTMHSHASHNIMVSLIWIAAVLSTTMPLAVVRYARYAK